MNVWANPDHVSLQQQGGVASGAGRDIDRDRDGSLAKRTSTSLGRDVGRMVRSSQDTLEPEASVMQPNLRQHCCSVGVCVVRFLRLHSHL